MGIPVLGTIARSLLTRGIRPTLVEYGQKRVAAASSQISEIKDAIKVQAKKEGITYNEALKKWQKDNKVPKKPERSYTATQIEHKLKQAKKSRTPFLQFSKGGLVKYKTVSKIK
tara:strand:- start:286 stop:627 length:342 start_codon:yes stop_codon:yes gene_type:complete